MELGSPISFGSETPFTSELLDNVLMPSALFSDRTEEEDPIVAMLNASVSKPPIAAITMTAVAASTSEAGKRGEVFFVVVVAAADVTIINFITNLTIVPSLHMQC